ncbi:hypothetical protein KC350_g1 [Hortaea werneckii]|nr:hypothetical protein KC350_g1 [Hortaea werneckii]
MRLMLWLNTVLAPFFSMTLCTPYQPSPCGLFVVYWDCDASLYFCWRIALVLLCKGMADSFLHPSCVEAEIWRDLICLSTGYLDSCRVKPRVNAACATQLYSCRSFVCTSSRSFTDGLLSMY